MSRQSGNVLFLILIAVALFAALAYAITSSSRTGGGNISQEKAKANAAAIIQYGTALRSAMMKMKLSGNCTDDIFEFNNSIYKLNSGAVTNTVNITAPVDKHCNLFDPAGGGMLPVVLSANAIDASIGAGNSAFFQPGHAGIRVAQIAGIGTDGAAGTVTANDIIFRTGYLNRETCMAINDLLNVPNPNGQPPEITATLFSYTNGSLASTGILNDPSIYGQTAFCLASPNPNFLYMHSLVDR